MNRYVLAVDLGTSETKVALVSWAGEIVGTESEPTELLILPEGGVEQRPEEWWSSFLRAAKRLLARDLVPPDRIVAIICAAQWSVTVALDREGNALMNAISWLDARGGKYVGEVTRGVVNIAGYGATKLARWVRLTGGVPAHSGKDPVGHICLIRNEFPEVYRATFKFLEPMDYLSLRLTGKFAASYHSIALHWVTDNRDLSNVRYDKRLLALCGLDREKLPDLLPTGSVLGPVTREVARELGVSERVQVVMGVADSSASPVGAGAVRDFEPHLYIGTSSWLTCTVPFKKTNLLRGIASLPCGIPGRYFVGVEQETAGGCLAALAEKVFYADDELGTGRPPADVFQRMDRIARGVPPGSEKLLFLPWLHGERTPVEEEFLRGGFLNQSLNTTRAHLVRAVLEGVAYNTRWMHESIERFLKRRLDRINFVGGGANSDVWCQIHADVLDRTVRQVRDPAHAGTRGAALLASLALGLVTLDQIHDRVEIVRTYEPVRENRKIYDELYREFRNVYKNNRKMYARLNSTG